MLVLEVISPPPTLTWIGFLTPLEAYGDRTRTRSAQRGCPWHVVHLACNKRIMISIVLLLISLIKHVNIFKSRVGDIIKLFRTWIICFLWFCPTQKLHTSRHAAQHGLQPAPLSHWGRDQMDAISQTTFSSAFSWMKMYEFRLKFVPKGPINNLPALVQIMAWCRPGAKPLSEPTMVSLTTHICVTRPQRVFVSHMLKLLLVQRHKAIVYVVILRG